MSTAAANVNATDPCVHCGFCLPTCASYRVLGTEMDSPRGRIYTLKAIATGELELDATVASHFDSCLGCFACVSACPEQAIGLDYQVDLSRCSAHRDCVKVCEAAGAIDFSRDARPQSERFDVVLALEVVEHVSDVPAFLAAAADRLAPGGILFVSTIDRTFKSFAVAIVGAEYLLRVLPRGTHQWSMFVRPEELRSALAPSKLHMNNLRGMRYLPVVHKASWCKDTKVNYIATFSHTAHHNSDH